jgi:hypothetical protein
MEQIYNKCNQPKSLDEFIKRKSSLNGRGNNNQINPINFAT